MTVSLIVAMTQDRVIGKNNTLPWPTIKEDMQHFRKITTGHPIIMGRKTYESIGRPLPKRTNIVITQQDNLKIDGCFIVNSFIEALSVEKADEVFVIGGASIYEQALPLADKIYLTMIKKSYSGDTFFPKITESNWNKTLLNETENVEFYFLEKSATI